MRNCQDAVCYCFDVISLLLATFALKITQPRFPEVRVLANNSWLFCTTVGKRDRFWLVLVHTVLTFSKMTLPLYANRKNGHFHPKSQSWNSNFSGFFLLVRNFGFILQYEDLFNESLGLKILDWWLWVEIYKFLCSISRSKCTVVKNEFKNS